MANENHIIQNHEARHSAEAALVRGVSEQASKTLAEDSDLDPTAPLPIARLFRDMIHGGSAGHVYPATNKLFTDYFTEHCEFADPTVSISPLKPSHVKGACAKAETHFVNAYHQIVFARENNDFHPILSVIHDEDGRPVVLKKQHDTSTGMLLHDAVTEQGLPLPAGTIVQTPELDISIQTGKARGSSEKSIFRTYEIPAAQLQCAPLRLSPWAYKEASYRESFAVTQGEDGSTVSFKRRRECVAYSIAMFRRAAEELVSRCAATDRL